MKGARPGSIQADFRPKQRLLAELVALREQKKKVEREIAEKEGKPATWAPFPAQRLLAPVQTVLPSPGPASKRPALSSFGGSDGKKQKLGDGGEKAREEVWRSINKVVTDLWKKPLSLHFRKPVDPQVVIGYYQVITHPMDLSTIKTKLASHAYASPYEVADDLRLIWANCRQFNIPGHPVRKAGDSMASAFEELWAGSRVEQTWDSLMEPMAPVSVQQQIDRLLPQYFDAMRRVTAIPRPPPFTVPPDRDMTPDEKRRLSVDLADLPPDRLSDCLRVIVEQMPQLAAGASYGDDQALEVDIDALTAETLWRLREVVEQPAGPLRVGGAVAAGLKAGSTAAAAGGARGGAAPPGVSGRLGANGKAPGGDGGAAIGNGGRLNRGAGADIGQDAGASQSDLNDGSDDDSEPHEVKGSTADDMNPSSFVRPSMPVAESGIQSKNQKTFVSSQAARKADAPRVNSAAWGDIETPAEPGAAANGGAEVKAEEGEDGLWSEFKTREQVQQQKMQQAEDLKKAEEDRRLKEREEQLAGAKRQVEEEAERARQLDAEVARQAAEAVAAREARKAQELAELQNRAGTANMLHQPDDLLPDIDRNHTENLTELGLTVKHSAHDIDFDD